MIPGFPSAGPLQGRVGRAGFFSGLCQDPDCSEKSTTPLELRPHDGDQLVINPVCHAIGHMCKNFHAVGLI